MVEKSVLHHQVKLVISLGSYMDTSLGIDYLNDWTSTHTERRLSICRTKTRDWFNNYFPHFYNKYEYFGTFNFDREWLKNNGTDEIKKSVKHFKSVVRKRLFGREKDFRLNFFPVVETKKWNSLSKSYLPVIPHVHILFGDYEIDTRLDKDLPDLLIDCWMTLQESDEKRERHQVKFVYGSSPNRCGESYLTKLRHSNVGFFIQELYTDYKRVDDDGETIFDKDGDFFEFLERHNYQFN
jgi:hypothetical protein